MAAVASTELPAASAPAVGFIALGANLEDPVAQVERGLAEISGLPGTRLLARSSLYRTVPVGYADQPEFINAVAQVATTLAPHELLAALLAIETRHGRLRGVPNGPRTLDLDVILYGDLRHHEAGLTIPHPRMHERAFVLVPLVEIAPGALIPGLGPARDWLERVDRTGITRIS